MITESVSVLAHNRGGDGEFFFFPLFFLILLGVGIFLLARRRRGGGPERWGAPSARNILDERFANGEIDRTEYEHRLAVLKGKGDVPPAPANPAPPRTATAVADPPSGSPADPPRDPASNPDD